MQRSPTAFVLGLAALALLLAAPRAAVASLQAADSPLRAQPSRWWDRVEHVDELLAEGKWKRARKLAEELRREVGSGAWRESDLGQVFAEIDFQIAVASAEEGDEERAVWEWYSALAHEALSGPARGGAPLVDRIERDLADAPNAAALFAAHPPRAVGEYPEGFPPIEVRPDVDFRPATSPDYSPEPLVNTTATRETVAPVHFEVFVAPDGEVSRPVVTTEWSHPVVIQWGLDSLRAAPRFEPARLRGEPVGWLVPVELDVSSRGPKRW